MMKLVNHFLKYLKSKYMNLLIYIIAQQVRVKPEPRTQDLFDANTSIKPIELHKQLVCHSKALTTYFKAFVFIFVSVSYLFEISFYFS